MKTKKIKEFKEALEQLNSVLRTTIELQDKQDKKKTVADFAKGGVIEKADFEREQILKRTCELPESILYDDPFISIHYLLRKHNFLHYDQAKDLFEFCKVQSIKKKECYGDGRAILHQWLDYKLHIPKKDD